ncbi:MAG: hypothetical protein JOZ10_07210, partial [Acidobacteria bacterium]|nr:hypothetical protein [Acidobacteriota bacterium]
GTLQADLRIRGLESIWFAMPAMVFLPMALPGSLRRRLLRRKMLTVLGLSLIVAFLLISAGCGGGGFNNPVPLQPGSGTNTTTQPGSYVVQITGTGPNGQTAVASIPMNVGF